MSASLVDHPLIMRKEETPEFERHGKWMNWCCSLTIFVYLWHIRKEEIFHKTTERVMLVGSIRSFQAQTGQKKKWQNVKYSNQPFISINKTSHLWGDILSVLFSSVTQLCLTLCDPTNRSTPGLLVHHQLPESTQTHVHRVGDAIQWSHPLLSPSPPAPSPSQHQGLSQWVNSLDEVAKVLEFQP